jgi:hypothetical protein
MPDVGGSGANGDPTASGRSFSIETRSGRLTTPLGDGVRAQRWSRRATPRFTVGSAVGAGVGSPSTPKSSPQRRQYERLLDKGTRVFWWPNSRHRSLAISASPPRLPTVGASQGPGNTPPVASSHGCVTQTHGPWHGLRSSPAGRVTIAALPSRIRSTLPGPVAAPRGHPKGRCKVGWILSNAGRDCWDVWLDLHTGEGRLRRQRD